MLIDEVLKLPVSVVLLCRNEEENLKELLPGLGWAREVVIVDNASTDGTVEYGKASGAIVVPCDSRDFSALRNAGIDASGSPWVFMLDADERIDDELLRALGEVCSAGTAEESYCVARKNYFFGQWVRHGGFYPDLQGRIFRNGVGIRYEGNVHETLNFKGRPRVLAGNLIHATCGTVAEYIEKLNRYSTLDSATRGTSGPLSTGKAIRIFLHQFYRRYVRKNGYKDGPVGFLLCFLMGTYEVVTYAKAFLDPRRPSA